jgi:pimeloyl-ACP methyl ester carboxylesterase
MDESPLEHLNFEVGDVHLHAVAAGPVNTPLVILLHGFPEFWYSWRHQIFPLGISADGESQSATDVTQLVRRILSAAGASGVALLPKQL